LSALFRIFENRFAVTLEDQKSKRKKRKKRSDENGHNLTGKERKKERKIE
jgi:hypothetical protein